MIADEEPVSHLIRDQDMKFEDCFNGIVESRDIKVLKLPRHSPNLNAFAERAIQSLKQECLITSLLLIARRPRPWLTRHSRCCGAGSVAFNIDTTPVLARYRQYRASAKLRR